MATTVPDLWPDDIKVDVLTPVAILKSQEGSLSRRTKGMIQAKVSTTESEKWVQHQLDLIVPSLNFYRERILSATHDRQMLYPVTVASEAFDPLPLNPMEASRALAMRDRDPSIIERRAATDDEFIALVQQVLRSETVRALIYSLIARINGTNEQTNGTAHADDKQPE